MTEIPIVNAICSLGAVLAVPSDDRRFIPELQINSATFAALVKELNEHTCGGAIISRLDGSMIVCGVKVIERPKAIVT